MEQLAQIVERTRTAAAAADRGDLLERLNQTARRRSNSAIRALVVGEFKQGKSLLVNAMVNAPICAVDDDIATSVPTMVRHGADSKATLVYAPPELAPGAVHRGRSEVVPTAVHAGAQGAAQEIELVREPVDIVKVAEFVSEAANPNNQRRLAYAEVELPRKLLTGGLVLVDTPGVGGIGSSHHGATVAVLPTADLIILVTDASQELTAPEVDFLRQAQSLCPNVACVLTKTDLYPHWREILEIDRRHLSAAGGAPIPIFAVSSTLRLHAIEHSDRILNEDSGFPVLMTYLRNEVVNKRDQLLQRSVANDVKYVLDNLSVSLQSELTALRDPENQRKIVAGLEAARRQADALGKRTSRWHQALNDGIADLQSDVDYDIRDRTRLIVQEAEQVIDQSDPAKIWDQFAEWLEQKISTVVADNFVWAHERSHWLAGQVAKFFSEEGGHALPEVSIADTVGVLDPVPELNALDEDRLSIGGKILVGMRGSYGGVLMFGLLTGIMGFALVNPISIGAGVLLGTKAYHDEKNARLKKRRADTKLAVRRHMDDVILHVTKESRDRVREVQRLLRDHFTEIADEMKRSLTDAVSAAGNVAKAGATERDQRIKQLTMEQERLTDLEHQARAVLNQMHVRSQSAA